MKESDSDPNRPRGLPVNSRMLINVGVFVVVVIIIAFRSGFLNKSSDGDLPRYQTSVPEYTVRGDTVQVRVWVWVEPNAAAQMIDKVLETVISERDIRRAEVDGQTQNVDVIYLHVFNKPKPNADEAKEPKVDNPDLEYRWTESEGLVNLSEV